MADLQHMPWSQSVVTLTPVDEGLPGQNLGEDDDDETVTLAGDRAIPQTGAVPDPANPSTFVLLLEHDDPSDTRIYTTDGRTMYTVTTRGQGASEMSRVLVTSLNDRLGQSIGSYIRPSGRGAEMVTLNGQEPVKRASWLASGRTFSNKLTSFRHNGVAYKWVTKEEDGGIALELLEEGIPGPIVRFIDSRRDWTVPPPRIVIQKARIEVETSALHMLDICVFSMLVSEKLRREKVPSSKAITFPRKETTFWYI